MAAYQEANILKTIKIEMKTPLVFFGLGANALRKCPLYEEKGWKLVRRTTDDSVTDGDGMAGTLTYGLG